VELELELLTFCGTTLRLVLSGGCSSKCKSFLKPLRAGDMWKSLCDKVYNCVRLVIAKLYGLIS